MLKLLNVDCNLYVYLRSSFWCQKRFYKGLIEIPQRVMKIKSYVNFLGQIIFKSFMPLRVKHLIKIYWQDPVGSFSNLEDL